jgi:hypothetical protein
MHAVQWGCNRSAAKEEEDKTQQQKSWNESEQTQKRVHAKRTYLPTYLPTSLSTYQTFWPGYRISRPADCFFGGQFCDVAKSGYIIHEEI